MPVQTPRGDAYQYEKLTVTNAVKALTSTVYDDSPVGPKAAVIFVETNGVRFKLGDPAVVGAVSATDGEIAPANSEIEVVGQANVKNFRAFRSGGADATIHVTYFR